MMPYIINVALILAGCLAFYKILLRKETFYRLNRFVLIACLFIAFSLPLLPVPQQWSFRKNETATIVQPTVIPGIDNNTTGTIPTITSTVPIAEKDTPASPANDSRFSFQQVLKWMVWLYWFGVIAFGINFLIQVIILLWKSYRHPVIIDGKFRIVEVSGDKAPCSFGNNIFINPEKYEWETYNQILQHEKVHIRQKHTLDILLAELVLVFQWFNPFAWVYRREMENNLEFLTDDQLTQKEKMEPSSYQLSLLKVSVPHFPLSLTTNYNQSILKKRIAMMNAKRSNLHTAWKYFFLLPVLALFACLLNEPRAQSNSNTATQDEKEKNSRGVGTEGYWFAVIKDDKVNIRFSDEDDMKESFDMSSHHSEQGSTFKLSELSAIPRGSSGTFKITREAGTMEMTGKFEENTGMGSYKFIADAQYFSYMNGEIKDKLDEDEQLAFFFIDIKKAYVQMLKSEGFSSLDKEELIPLAALKVDAAFIKSIKENGFKDVDAENLVTLKALGIDAAYIKEIQSSGLKNIDLDKLVSFKAQGIDKEYITKMRAAKEKDGGKLDEEGDDIISYKAMNITEEFINSFKAIGYTNLDHENLVSFKAMGITPEYIKSWLAHGHNDLDPETIVGLKSQGITPEYMKSFTDMGYKNVDPEDLISLKALNVTADYIKSFETAGYKNIDIDDLTSLKALGITPEFIKSFEAIGFKNIPIDDLTSVKAMGVTPAYITSMKEKGFSYDKLQKYVMLKSID